MVERCMVCGEELEETEYFECAECADMADMDNLAEYMEERFDMETEAEWLERKENKW